MTDRFDEKFSAFVDGETRTDSDLLSRLHNDDALRDRWSRYHLIRDVMTSHYQGRTQIDIASAVKARLEQEPTILAPRTRSIVSATRHIGKQVAGYALAATVAGVSVFTVQQYNLAKQDAGPVMVATTANLAPQGVSYIPAATNVAIQNKLSGYLVTHNEYSASTKMQGMLPYMRIVSHTITQQSKQ